MPWVLQKDISSRAHNIVVKNPMSILSMALVSRMILPVAVAHASNTLRKAPELQNKKYSFQSSN